jgi:hypothetical protein
MLSTLRAVHHQDQQHQAKTMDAMKKGTGAKMKIPFWVLLLAVMAVF